MKGRLLIVSILLLSMLVGCGNSSKGNINYETSTEETVENGFGDFNEEYKAEMDSLGEATTNSEIEESNRKIIKKADLNLETDKFEETVNAVENYISEFGGYIEASNVYQDGINSSNYKNNRSAEFTIRVPKSKFEALLEKYGSLGVVTNKRLYGDDVSSDYFDKESRLEVLKAQENRYLDILSKAESVTEVIEVEKVLTEVRYEIEYLTGYLKKMDDLISMSTINLYVYEVSKTNEVINEPKTLGDKMVNTFNSSIKALGEVATGMVLLVVAAIPFLIIPIIIAIIVILILRKTKKNKDIKNNNKE